MRLAIWFFWSRFCFSSRGKFLIARYCFSVNSLSPATGLVIGVSRPKKRLSTLVPTLSLLAVENRMETNKGSRSKFIFALTIF